METSEVFTPRSTIVNLKVYVPRLNLENELARSVKGSLHTILFGESGNGKSWLYKKVFAQHGYHFKVANCAIASRLDSVAKAINYAIFFNSSKTATNFDAIQNLQFIEHANLEQPQTNFGNDPLYEAFSKFRKDINKGDGVIVLENLEAIFENEKLMNELSDILLLLDDPVYGVLNIKILLVGVPNDILDYFTKTKNVESVSNRLQEISKVVGLNKFMVKTLIIKGFNESLRYNFSDEIITEISDHVHHITLGVAQRVQEYCEKLSYKLEDSKRIYTHDLLHKTDTEWLKIGLRQSYTVIESHLNSNNTTIARRNQVIYCLGRVSGHQVDATAIAERIKIEFPSTTKEKNMGVAAILSELSKTDMPILRKNPITKDYRIIDPRYMTCIRVMLYKNPLNSTVEKRSFQF